MILNRIRRRSTAYRANGGGTKRPVSQDCWIVGNHVTVHYNGRPVRAELLRAPRGTGTFNDPSAPYWMVRISGIGHAAVHNGQVVEVMRPKTIRPPIPRIRGLEEGPMTKRSGFQAKRRVRRVRRKRK